MSDPSAWSVFYWLAWGSGALIVVLGATLLFCECVTFLLHRLMVHLRIYEQFVSWLMHRARSRSRIVRDRGEGEATAAIDDILGAAWTNNVDAQLVSDAWDELATLRARQLAWIPAKGDAFDGDIEYLVRYMDANGSMDYCFAHFDSDYQDWLMEPCVPMGREGLTVTHWCEKLPEPEVPA